MGECNHATPTKGFGDVRKRLRIARAQPHVKECAKGYHFSTHTAMGLGSAHTHTHTQNLALWSLGHSAVGWSSCARLFSHCSTVAASIL